MGTQLDFIKATADELRAAYPTWKTPLATPTRRMVKNPFSGALVEEVVWDPTPDDVVEDAPPQGPPLTSVDMKGLGPESVATLGRLLDGASEVFRAGSFRPALIGPIEGPWIFELPDTFIDRLGALDENAREQVARDWATAGRADIASIRHEGTRAALLAAKNEAHWRSSLETLAEFARAAVAEHRRVFMMLSL